jgi:hypothetical protein
MECFHDQGQEANFAHIPVTVQVVAGYTHRRRPAQLGPHDSAPSVRSPPPPPSLCYLHFLLYSRNNVLPPFNGPALGTSVSPVSLFRVGREENRESRSEAEFPELLSWSVQVQGIAQVSREIWDRMASLFK